MIFFAHFSGLVKKRVWIGNNMVRSFTTIKLPTNSGITFELASTLAERSDGSIIARQGNTVIHATCVIDKMEPKRNEGESNFFPLTVHYREKAYAVAGIPKTFNRREFSGRDGEVLVGRAVDRALRPLVKPGFYYSTQLIVTVHSYDGIHDPELLALNACSAALHVSGLPWEGPVGAVRVCAVKGHYDEDTELVINLPLSKVHDDSTVLNMTVAGLGEHRTVMLEASAREVTNKLVLDGLQYAESTISDLVQAQKKLFEEVKNRKIKEGHRFFDYRLYVPSEELRKVALKVASEDADRFAKSINITKRQREVGQGIFWSNATKKMRDYYLGVKSEDPILEQEALHDVLQDSLRRTILETSKRPDGRGESDIRSIDAAINLLPRVHGSALFGRGNTQVLCSVALGPYKYARSIFSPIEPTRVKQFVLNYNFPPYAVNRTGEVFGPNRRMVGHGALAEKAISPLIAMNSSSFPYAVNVTAETTGSDGSSSMASVCGASLALMDAGVPLRRLAAGVSVGLYTDPVNENRFALPIDILGLEDHFGDMDFKIAGTERGLTAMQLDIKRPYLTFDMVSKALEKAQIGRSEIISKMIELTGISSPREEPKSISPLFLDIQVSPFQVRALAADGKRLMGEIEEICKVSIDLNVGESSGSLRIFSQEIDQIKKAKDIILKLE